MAIRFPRAGLLMVGAGSLEESLRARIARTPYGDHVLLYGDMPHGVTLRAMLECDLLLRTTRYDGDSVSARRTPHGGCRQPGGILAGADCGHAVWRSCVAVRRHAAWGDATRHAGMRPAAAHHAVRWRFGFRARGALPRHTGDCHR